MEDKTHGYDFDYEFDYKDDSEYLISNIEESIPQQLAFSIFIIKSTHEHRVDHDNDQNKVIKHWPALKPHELLPDRPFGLKDEQRALIINDKFTLEFLEVKCSTIDRISMINSEPLSDSLLLQFSSLIIIYQN